MPLALRIGAYRFFFWSRENSEPPHVHVKREKMEAKFWIQPVELAQNWGFARHELNHVTGLVQQASGRAFGEVA
jgi:hypothetical protein